MRRPDVDVRRVIWIRGWAIVDVLRRWERRGGEVRRDSEEWE